jgi:hypothetical protein
MLLVICLCKVFSFGHGNEMAPHFSDATCKKNNLSYIQKTCCLFRSLITSCLLKTFILKTPSVSFPFKVRIQVSYQIRQVFKRASSA